MGLSPSSAPPPHSSSSPNKSLNSKKKLSFFKWAFYLVACAQTASMDRTQVRRMQTAERRPRGGGHSGTYIVITQSEISIAKCFPVFAPIHPGMLTTTVHCCVPSDGTPHL